MGRMGSLNAWRAANRAQGEAYLNQHPQNRRDAELAQKIFEQGPELPPPDAAPPKLS